MSDPMNQATLRVAGFEVANDKRSGHKGRPYTMSFVR